MIKQKPMLRIISCILTLCFLSGGIPVIAESGTDTQKNTNAVIFSEDFDVGVGITNKLLDGRLSPVDWTYSDNRVPATPALLAGIDTEEKASGEASLCVQASNHQNVGFLSPKITMCATDGTINIELDVKASSDYAENNTKLSVEFYNGERKLTSNEATLKFVNGEWTHNVVAINRQWYPRIPFDGIKIRLFTVYNGKDNAPAGGMVYFDNLKLVRTDAIKECQLDILCDAHLCWYQIGETVTFKPQADLPSQTTTVVGTVYNSWNEPVWSGEVSAYDFAQKGWQYTPDEVGFYEVEFVAYTPNDAYKLISRYVAKTLFYTIPRRTFVVATPTKPLEERNEALYGNFYEKVGAANVLDTDDVCRMHDVIGFYGLRGFIPWEIESMNVHIPANPGKGIYCWDTWDPVFEDIRKYGFEVMASIMFTPQWASTYAANTGASTVAAVQTSKIIDWSCAPPTRNEYWLDYVEKFAERYGDCVTTWEIWNEMNPGSRFFEHGTVEEYVELLKVSRELLSEIQPGDKVITGGLMGGSAYYWDELLAAGAYDYTDAMAIHGHNTIYEDYKAVYEKYGLEEKPYYNNEAHYYVSNTTGRGMDWTDRQDAMRLIKGYLYDFYLGAEMIGLFQVVTNVDKEELPEYQKVGQRAVSHGLWRRRPFNEPKLPAKVMHTFFDVIGKEFVYDSQYTFNDGISSAMCFKNDGENTLFLWSETDDYTLDPVLLAGLTPDAEIIDWEGRPVKTDDVLRSKTVYFIKGVDTDAFRATNEHAGTSVALTSREKEKQEATEVAYANAKPVFDKNTFAVADNITWIENDWQWREKTGPMPEGHKARAALTVNEEGVYLLVEVDDANPVFEFKDTTGPDTMYNSDCVEFAIDVSGEGYSDMKTEIHCSILDGKPTLFKRCAANVFGAIPAGWTVEKGVLDASHVQVTAENGKTVWKIFVPITEYYPFKLEDTKGYIRFSMTVDECDGKSRRGLMRWSDGIDGGKLVGKYGKIILP